jgi:hypothetical protein
MTPLVKNWSKENIMKDFDWVPALMLAIIPVAIVSELLFETKDAAYITIGVMGVAILILEGVSTQ